MKENIVKPISEIGGIELTAAAQKTLSEYLARVEKSSEDAKKIALVIIVWGPGLKSGTPTADKRREIRDELNRIGHAAVFSEDLPPRRAGRSQKSLEYDQAAQADLIVVLMDSMGSVGEVHDFCDKELIAPKMYVMVSAEHRDGYSAAGALNDLDDGYRGVYWYRADEIPNCSVLTLVLKRAEARRRIRYQNLGGIPQ